jgi:hypothetical protein
MNSNQLHETGYHYVSVLMDNDRVFNEIFHGYQEISNRLSWHSALSLSAFNDSIRSNAPLIRDPQVCFIVWHDIAELFKQYQKPAGPFILRYCEVIGNDVWPAQQLNITRLLKNAKIYDGIIVHTDFARQFLINNGFKVGKSPIGYNYRTMGIPDSTLKEFDIIFYGSHVVDKNGKNRRAEIITKLRKYLRLNLVDISGAFWPHRNELLNRAKAVLILHQIDTPHSFPTMRLWQSIASSAGMIIEQAETWPMEAGKHYLQIPIISSNNVKEVSQIIEQHITIGMSSKFASDVHRELSHFTYEYCLENFAIPEIQKFVTQAS